MAVFLNLGQPDRGDRFGYLPFAIVCPATVLVLVALVGVTVAVGQRNAARQKVGRPIARAA